MDLRKQPEFVRGAVPPTECPRCRALGEFDDIEATYVAYVAGAPTLQLPAAIEAAIDGACARKQALQVHKVVEGDLTVLWLKGTIDKSARLKRHGDGLEGTVLVILESAEAATMEGLANLSDLARTPTAIFFSRACPWRSSRALRLIPPIPGATSSRA